MSELLELLKNALSGAWGSDVGPLEVVLALCFSVLIAVYIYFVYLLIVKKSFYSKEFNITLIGVCLITTTLVITIQSSLLVSLSVGGALSIVRFRTAIKSSIDMMFLFWSIAVGIMCGTGVALYAMILSIVLTLVILILMKLPLIRSPRILVINTFGGDEKIVLETVKKYSRSYEVKACNLSVNRADYTIEVRSDDCNLLVKELSALTQVSSVSLLSYDSDSAF